MFTATEKVLIRQVFLMWANAAVQGYMHPAPVGVVQDPTMLLPGARGMANNYASAHMRQLAYYALSFDAADDPPVDLTLPEVRLLIVNGGGFLHLQSEEAIQEVYTCLLYNIW